MKRTAYSVIAAIIVIYTVYALGPQAAHDHLSTQTIAQESPPNTAKVAENPFADPIEERRKTPPVEPGSAPRGDQPQPADTRKPIEPTASDAIEAKLSTSGSFEFIDISLQDMVDSLSAKLEIPMVIDRKGLEDAGIGTDKVVGLPPLRGIRTDKYLDLLASEMELAWIIRDGYVLITTPEKLESLQEVRVYNCSDLIEMVKATPPGGCSGGGGSFGGFGGGGGENAPAPGTAPPGGRPGGFFAVPSEGIPPGVYPQLGGGINQPVPPGSTVAGAAPSQSGGAGETSSPQLVPDNDSLIDVIVQTIEPDTWTDAGGSGSIESYHGGLLVINQSGPVHRRIEILLKMMRQAKQANPGTVMRER